MPTGIVTTYDLNVGVIVDIDEVIKMLDPTETPLQSGVGADGRTVLSSNSCFEKKVEWQDEELLIPESTLGASTTTDTTVVTVASGHRLRFSTGDAIKVQAEQVRVTGYGSTADTLLVSRAYNGTTGATHATGIRIVNLGANLPEGSDPEAARSIDRVNRYNVTQIFGPTAITVSGTENAVKKYGLTGTEFDKQAANRGVEEKIKLEHALIYGGRYEDGSGKIRQMGGMHYYITSNVDSSTTAIGATALLDMLQDIWDAGGDPDRALLGGAQKRKVSAIDEGDIRLGRADVGRGQTVDYFDSDFSRVSMILHRRMESTDMTIFSRDQATRRILRPWQFKMLGDTGDSQKGIMVHESTLQFERQRHAGRFSALTV